MSNKSDASSGADSAHGPKSPKPNHLLVEVATTAGIWPSDGPEEVPNHQKVKVVLTKAADSLQLRDTSNWIASVDGLEINPELNYVDQTLAGHIVIDYGPREGGGGRE